MTDVSSSLHQQFQDAINDLWWMSETDAPIGLEIWSDAFADGFSIQEMLSITEHEADLPCQEVSLDQLFGPAVREQDWHGEPEKEDVRRFRALRSLIDASLSDIHVVKVGEVNLDIYIVGQTRDGEWFVLSTQAVET